MTRQVNPDELDHLAGLLEGTDGQSGVAFDLQTLFNRAANLDARGALSPLNALQTWAGDTATDLRGRAELIREDVELGPWLPSVLASTLPGVLNVKDMVSAAADSALTPLAVLAAFKGRSVFGAFPAPIGGLGTNLVLAAAGRGSQTYGITARLATMIAGRLPTGLLTALYGTPGALSQNMGTLGRGALASLRGGSSLITAASRYGGLLRWAGVGGGVFSTGVGVVDLVSQGNPVDAFKNDPSGYSVDVTGTIFSGAMTAALVAPNPVTAGIAAGAAVLYGGALIWDNHEAIGEWFSDTWDATSGAVADGWNATTDAVGDAWDATTDTVGDVVDGAGDVVEGVGDFVGGLF